MATRTVEELYQLDSKVIGDAIKVRYYPFVAAKGDGARLGLCAASRPPLPQTQDYSHGSPC